VIAIWVMAIFQCCVLLGLVLNSEIRLFISLSFLSVAVFCLGLVLHRMEPNWYENIMFWKRTPPLRLLPNFRQCQQYWEMAPARRWSRMPLVLAPMSLVGALIPCFVGHF
jgi:hypothetical protein